MKYESIQGWTDFSIFDLYQLLVEYLPINKQCKVVEVGCWLGQSTVLLAETIRRYNRNCIVYAVDTWLGSPTELEHQKLIEEMGGTENFYQNFLKNIEPFKDIIRPIRMASVDAAKQFTDRELDWVFIDGGHTYEDVYSDVLAWLPKIKNFGALCGHDADSLEIQRALDDIFGKRPRWHKRSNTWTYQV